MAQTGMAILVTLPPLQKLLQGVEKRSERASGKEGTGEKAEFTWRK
jgi:hypothetical protein